MGIFIIVVSSFLGIGLFFNAYRSGKEGKFVYMDTDEYYGTFLDD